MSDFSSVFSIWDFKLMAFHGFRIEDILKNEPSNASRCKLLVQLRDCPVGDEQEQFECWLSSQKTHLLKNLKASHIGEIYMYLNLALENGGLKFMEDTYVYRSLQNGISDLLSFL